MKNRQEKLKAMAMKTGVVAVGADNKRSGALFGSADRSVVGTWIEKMLDKYRRSLP
jgi:hypothetical protein